MGQRAAVRNYLYPVSPLSSIPVPSPASPAFQPGQDLPDGAGMAIVKGNPGSCANRNRGWHGAVSAPCTAASIRTMFYDLGPSPGPGSTLIQRQTPKRGQGPQQQAGPKQVSAWRHPPFSVCAVPTHGPEGSRAELPVSCFAAQLNTCSVSRLSAFQTEQDLPDGAGMAIVKENPGSCANRNRGWHGA